MPGCGVGGGFVREMGDRYHYRNEMSFITSLWLLCYLLTGVAGSIVHYVWADYHSVILQNKLNLLHYVSVASTIKHVKPKGIYFWCFEEPEENDWWKVIKPLVTIKYLDASMRLRSKEGLLSDYLGLIKLLEFGGVYVNWETVFLRNAQHLFTSPAIPTSNGPALYTGIVASGPRGEFLDNWLSSAASSLTTGQSLEDVLTKTPLKIASNYPELVLIPPIDYPRVEQLFEEETTRDPFDQKQLAFRAYLTESYPYYLGYGVEDVEELMARPTVFYQTVKPYLSLFRCVPNTLYWLNKSPALLEDITLPGLIKESTGGIPNYVHLIAGSQWWKKGEELSWKRHNPQHRVIVWTEMMMKAMVKRHYPWHYALFGRLDRELSLHLFKYLLLYIYGGIYADLNQHCLTPIAEWPLIQNASVVLAVGELEEEERGEERIRVAPRDYRVNFRVFGFARKHRMLGFLKDLLISNLRVMDKHQQLHNNLEEIAGVVFFSEKIFYFLGYLPSQFKKSTVTMSPWLINSDTVVLPAQAFLRGPAYRSAEGGPSLVTSL